MTIHEFGRENKKTIVLIHPSAVMWDYFEYVIPLLEASYHLIVPALPGYDKAKKDEHFTSVEEISADIALWVKAHGIPAIDLLYGCSMGGSIALKMLSDKQIEVRNTVCDGGITPYRLPWIVTRFIALRDFLTIAIGKIGGLKLIARAFATDEYSPDDLKYIAEVLSFMSCKTIWRTFDSCNNYAMPNPMPEYHGVLQYWYGDMEKKERSWDIKYVKENFPDTSFVQFENRGHASMAVLYPQETATLFKNLIEG